MKKLIALLLSIVMVFGLVACSSEPADDKALIEKNGKLVIGITDYEPMNYKDANGNWTGFDTEFAQKVCEKLGVKAEFVEIDWDNKFMALESKTIDCIWNGMTISDEVLNNTSCSDAYVKNAQVVVINKAKLDAYKDADSMKDLKFAVEAGSAGKAAADEKGFANVVEAGTQTDALLEVQSGSCDACIIDITMANAMVGKDGSSYADLAISIELTSEEYGIGFRKGSNLTDEVNKIMAEMKADGTLKALADKYQLTLAE